MVRTCPTQDKGAASARRAGDRQQRGTGVGIPSIDPTLTPTAAVGQTSTSGPQLSPFGTAIVIIMLSSTFEDLQAIRYQRSATVKMVGSRRGHSRPGGVGIVLIRGVQECAACPYSLGDSSCGLWSFCRYL